MEAKVTDNSGRDWHVTITLRNARTIKNDLGIDLFDFSRTGGFMQLAADPELLGDVFVYLVNDQKERLRLTDKKLTKLFRGKYKEVVEAMKAAYLNFYPPQKRGRVQNAFRPILQAIPVNGGKSSPNVNQQSDSAATTSDSDSSSTQQEPSSGIDGDIPLHWQPPS